MKTNQLTDIGIIGGGIAGLTTAWLLDESYDIVLFEKEPQLGGHAQTVSISLPEGPTNFDIGVEFFIPKLFPHFFQLLRHFSIATKSIPLTSTFYNNDPQSELLFPPLSTLHTFINSIYPKNLRNKFYFNYFIKMGKTLIAQKNTALTLKEFADSLSLPDQFKTTILYPLLSAGWGTTTADFTSFSAYNILKWIEATSKGPWPERWFEIIGGTSTYINAIAHQLTRTTLKTSTIIKTITYENSYYKIVESDGTSSLYKHLILATNPQDACLLLNNIAHAEPARTVLDTSKSFPSLVMIHGDFRFMPKNRASWSINNVKFDGHNGALTVYKPWKTDTPVFKSWIILDQEGKPPQHSMPEPLYAFKYFKHQKSTPAYFKVQKNLATLQGQHNLWFVGTYTHDFDSHESALNSALLLAKKFNPDAQRLKIFDF